MEVRLLEYQRNARELLLYTKETRLQDQANGLEVVMGWPEEKKQEELLKVLTTIQSSWEFLDYIFEIRGVTRAFTHQFVRTRTGSYAQQSQRAVNLGAFDYLTPETIDSVPARDERWDDAMRVIGDTYQALMQDGVPAQDARGILPNNALTNIQAKFNLRTLSDTAKTRLCVRTQGEYQNVFKEMRKRVLEVHPWTEPFIRVACAATGVCAFPRFETCPIKGPVFNPETGYRYDGNLCESELGKPETFHWSRPATKQEIQSAWEAMGTHETDPTISPHKS